MLVQCLLHAGLEFDTTCQLNYPARGNPPDMRDFWETSCLTNLLKDIVYKHTVAFFYHVISICALGMFNNLQF